MKFGSLFTGVGGFDLGFERVGMTCAWQAENNKYSLQVLNNHWPAVRKYEDVRNVGRDAEAVDLICGGFPCQDLSVAGKRAGLAGERSGLWFEFRRIIEELRPTWVVIENVPGLLSSDKGRDLSILLGGLAQLRYGWAYRVLDSQYFGVAQRRRRVFIVASSRNATDPAKVLFESESRDWDTAPRRDDEEAVAVFVGESTSRNSNGSGFKTNGTSFTLNGVDRQVVASGKGYAGTLAANYGTKYGLGNQEAFRGEHHVISFHNRQVPISVNDVALPAGAQDNGLGLVDDGMARRFTPLEWERLQGFPDNWTAEQADVQRYEMMGNAVTVNVIEWIGKRIIQVEGGLP